jgi:hypothetical protein
VNGYVHYGALAVRAEQVSAVPILTAAGFLLSGLGGLGFLRRRFCVWLYLLGRRSNRMCNG